MVRMAIQGPEGDDDVDPTRANLNKIHMTQVSPVRMARPGSRVQKHSCYNKMP